MWVHSFWSDFGWIIILAACGLITFFLLSLLTARGGTGVVAFYWFTPEHPSEKIAMLAVRMLVWMALLIR